MGSKGEEEGIVVTLDERERKCSSKCYLNEGYKRNKEIFVKQKGSSRVR